MKHEWTLIVFMSFFLLAGCAKPLPKNKLDYAGMWRNEHVLLYISPDGQVRYAKQENRTSTSINAPIKSFVGDDFEVGVGPFYTTFKVTKRPYLDGGVWKMEVDGEILIKSAFEPDSNPKIKI